MMENTNPWRDFLTHGTGCNAHVVLGLEVHPETRLHVVHNLADFYYGSTTIHLRNGGHCLAAA